MVRLLTVLCLCVVIVGSTPLMPFMTGALALPANGVASQDTPSAGAGAPGGADPGVLLGAPQEMGVESVSDDASATAKLALKALQEGDFSAAAERGTDLLIQVALPALAALVALIVAYFIASFFARVGSAPVRKKIDETLGRFVDKLIYYLVMLGAVLGILQYFGIGVTSFAAVLGAAGFAVGLAFQGTLSNFSSGIMLLVFRPFKVEDVIHAAGITAKVFEIDLFHTVFDTPDNRRIIVPNSAIVGGTIENISHHDVRRVDVSVGIDYAAGLDQSRDALSSAAGALKEKMVEGEGRGYQIVLVDLGDSSVNWTVRFWAKSEDFWGVKEQLTYEIKTKLDAAGIGIPFPQMDVHVHRQDD